MVKYTEQECAVFNSLLHDYLKIDSDSALEERGLSYEEYKEMGLELDTLRFDKAVCTNQTRARYYSSFGMRMEPCGDGKWRVTYQEGQLYKACPTHNNGRKGRDKWQKKNCSEKLRH